MIYPHLLLGGVRKVLTGTILFIMLVACTIARAEAPKAFWHSQPVKPNETVMVQGHAISTETLVDAQRLDDGYAGFPLTQSESVLTNPTRIAPLSFGESLLNFVIPSSWPAGVFAYRLVNDTAGAVHLVNAPDPWFIHGDQGNRSTPGGWVAVYGNNLSMAGGASQLALVNNGVVSSLIAARNGGNAYAQYFDLPADLPAGMYEVYVHNGFGGPAAWTRLQGNESANSDKLKIVSRSTLWETIARAQPEVVIDAANGNGGAANWDAVFAAAIATVSSRKDANNNRLGGVIRVKPGVYTLDKYLVLPDKTILVGENKDTTILQWGESATPDPAGRNPLVIGETLVVWPAARGTFSIEDLTLSRTSPNRVGGCIERAYTNTDEQSAWFRRIVCEEPNTAEAANSAILANATSNMVHNRPAFWMRSTKNTEITDSTIDMILGITLAGQVSANEFVRVENNTFRWRLAPLNVLYGLKNLIYAGNTEFMLGTEIGNGTGAWADVGNSIGSFTHNNRDIYFGQNEMLREGNDVPYIHQGLTLDGNAGVYLGKISSVSGTQINLAGYTSIADPQASQRPRAQQGAMVQILSGKGAGQWRHLMSPVLDANKQPVNVVEVDRTWDVEPDGSSWLSINDFQGRMIFYGNNLENGPKLQLYYASHDVIVAENLLSTRQTAAVPVWVGYRSGGYGSMTHGWHYQVIDNISAGPVTTTMPTVITSLDTGEPLVPQWGSYPGYDGSYVSTHIYRNNRNENSSVFEINPGDQNAGFLVEGNYGLSWMLFKEPPLKQEIGLIRNNSSPTGNRPQLLEKSGNRFPTNPGPDVTFSYTNGTIVNLARSGLATAVNDFGGYGRIKPIDGDTGSSWAGSGGMATSGTANQAWIQVDLRTSDVIQSVKIWPRLDANSETADVWVLVSPTPFTSNDLNTEKSRPEVFSQFLQGKFSGVRTVDLPVASPGGGHIGRYVRAWKVFPTGVTGQLQFAEIEVFGYGSLDLGVTVVADAGSVIQGNTVNYTVTVTNYGSNPATNVTTTGTLADCNLGTVNSQASVSCTRPVVASAAGTLTQTVNVSTSDPEPDSLAGNNTVTVSTNVQALISVNKTGTGIGTVTSSPAGISCGADCTEPYDANTVVTLAAAANAGSVFTGWSGACSGTSNDCTVTLDTSKTAMAMFNIKTADLSVSNAASPPPVLVNDNIVYTLQVNNAGPQAATAVTLTDAIPAGASLVSVSSDQGSCSGTSTVNCALGTLNNGATATVTLTVKGTAAGSLRNTATVSAFETDPVAANNSATTTTTVLGSCIGSSGKNISGTVKRSNNTAISGVSMLLIRTSTTSQCGSRVITGSNGNYQFSKLSNATYSVTPSKTGCTGFTPSSRVVMISSGNKTGENFSGDCP